MRHALPAIAGWVNRWTGYVFGVYPLYDVYDNPRGTLVLGRKLELFLAHGRLCSPIPSALDPLIESKRMVELDGIEPTT